MGNQQYPQRDFDKTSEPGGYPILGRCPETTPTQCHSHTSAAQERAGHKARRVHQEQIGREEPGVPQIFNKR